MASRGDKKVADATTKLLPEAFTSDPHQLMA